MVEGEAGGREMIHGMSPLSKTIIIISIYDFRHWFLLIKNVCIFLPLNMLLPLLKKKKNPLYFHELKWVKQVQVKLSDGLCKAGRHKWVDLRSLN